MNNPADAPVRIQTSSSSAPSTPLWFGEVAVTASHFRHQGILAAINERVRFARRRFGHYDLIDFVIVLLGYAISGERTLETFYESLQPFSAPFMALFGRERLPHRSTLSRFLAALNQAAVEALRTCFSKTSSRDLWKRRKNREGCGTGKEHNGWYSMWTALGRPHVNGLCHPHLICHRHSAV